LTFSIWKG